MDLPFCFSLSVCLSRCRENCLCYSLLAPSVLLLVLKWIVYSYGCAFYRSDAWRAGHFDAHFDTEYLCCICDTK